MTDRPLRRILYISTARQPITPADREAVLRVSRRNNARVGITGLLVTGGRRFLQVLEGEPDAIEATVARITADPRHFAMVVLSDERIADRCFPQWAMGQQDGAADAGPDTDLAALIASIPDPVVRANFEGFAAVHRRAA